MYIFKLQVNNFNLKLKYATLASVSMGIRSCLVILSSPLSLPAWSQLRYFRPSILQVVVIINEYKTQCLKINNQAEIDKIP